MACCNSAPFSAFDGRILSTEAGLESSAQSGVFEMQGDDLSVALSIYGISGAGPQLTLQVRGSLDGIWYQDIGAPVTRTTFGVAFGNITNVQFKYLKVVATYTTSAGTGNVHFTATLYGRESA